MPAAHLPSARFRKATEFPQTIAGLEQADADALYTEMRDCLVFTNRSRGQLIRRNEEHKAKAGLLKTDIQRLQGIISQLATEKQQISAANQAIIQDLTVEIAKMATHLDELSLAFDGVAEIETADQSQWHFVSLPNRFFRFLKAVKAVVLWWRSEHPLAPTELSASQTHTLPGASEDLDRRHNPQMYTDSASVNRSLLDR
ncbi:hypothetical protein GS597_05605 [Synechococcales cyanobacterium C]|uniref:Uncharacterized protein n=1 Tax=Petrachloros mirabilis ULC683 TaxID=2781853 RepID=A0A8K2A7E4_9CYAN|nr:hypothetical protein [Petrachloros mirabilis]NCJ05995.1 hypothetical protein [Petrachloros mirabilis ULC683]